MDPVFFLDFSYLVILLPCLLISAFAQANVSSTFNRYSRVRNRRNMTGAEAAEAVLRANGVRGVRIERVAGKLTDHYDPRTNVIRLSQGVYDAATVSAVGVAAHEAGHAVQYAQRYAPVRVRNAVIPVCNAGSQISIILLLVGILLYSQTLFGLGVLCFGLSVFVQLITLPVEFNASRRAVVCLEENELLYEDELTGAKKVLRAAALTYVAALLTSLAQLLRFVVVFLGQRGREQ